MRRLHLVAAAFAAIAGACHTDDSFRIDASVDPGRPDTELREACLEQAEAWCAWQQRCEPYAMVQSWPAADDCVDRMALDCQLQAADPHANLDDAAIRECALPADHPCRVDPGYDSARDEHRQRCSRGDLVDGSTCSTDAACASGWCVRDYPAEPCGTCGVPVCPCSELETCELVDGKPTCVPLLADGATGCSGATDCVSLFCDGGVCAPRPTVGTACNGHCGAVFDLGLECNPNTLTCEPVITMGPGDSCGTLDDEGICGFATLCHGTDEARVCTPPAADGAPCNSGPHVDCSYPARCLDGFCRFQSAQSCPPDGSPLGQ